MNKNCTIPKFTKGGVIESKENPYLGGDNTKELMLSKVEVILKGYEKDEYGYDWPIYEVKK